MPNMHDVVRRLEPGHVISWTDSTGRFTYVGYVAGNMQIYTTATEHNIYVPQVMTLSELANMLDNENISLFLASGWEVQDHFSSTPPPLSQPAIRPNMVYKSQLFDNVSTAAMMQREMNKMLKPSTVKRMLKESEE